MIVAAKTAWLFHLEVSPVVESSDWWDLELVLENFRTPVRIHDNALSLARTTSDPPLLTQPTHSHTVYPPVCSHPLCSRKCRMLLSRWLL